MADRSVLRRFTPHVLVVVVGVLGLTSLRIFLRFRPAAITLGPSTTLYLEREPLFETRLHEAVHRRQMRDKSLPGRVVSAIRYNFDYGYRLDEEAEAKAGEVCLQIHRFSSELPAYTSARSESQARAYRAWAWERVGLDVPDRVGEQLDGGERCHQILRDVELDLPPGAKLSPRDRVRLATFNFLRAYGSTEREVRTWRARLRLVGYAEPVPWIPEDGGSPRALLGLADSVAPPRVPTGDESVDEVEAGRALHRMTYSAATHLPSSVLPAPPGYRRRPLLQAGDAEAVVGVPLELWPHALVEHALRRRFDPDEVLWLEGLAAHPLHRDFDAFARATTADVAGTRYRASIEEGWERSSEAHAESLRTAFRVQWGRVALALHRGEVERGEALLERVVAAALLLARETPIESEAADAVTFLDHALRGLWRLGRHQGVVPPWLDRYRALSSRTRLRPPEGPLASDEPAELYRAMPAVANDPSIPYALKRRAYRRVVLADVCLERAADAPARAEHRRWRERVEAGLVRRESDRRILERMRMTVRFLLLASRVEPVQICAPGRGVRRTARMAIMLAPLGTAPSISADQ